MEYLKLSDCSDYSNKRTSNIQLETYISTENMLPNKGGVVKAESIPNCKSTSKYEPHDILLSNIRPYFCKIWYADKEGGCSNDVLVIKAKKGYLPKFLYYVLSDQNFFNYDTVTSKGTKMPRGSKNAIMKYLVPDVDISTQRRIASILSAYDNLIENNNKRIRLLEQMAENLYKEWFVRFRFPGHEKVEMENGLPKGWKVEKLGDWGISLESGGRPKGGIDDTLNNGVPSLGAEAIKGLAEYDYSSTKYVSAEFYNAMKRGKNSGNDILLYKDGAYIGRVTLFREGFPYDEYSINEHVFFIAPYNVKYQNYLYFTLHQDAFFTLMQNLNRNAAQPGLSRPDVERIKMVIPTESIIKEFNQNIEPILSCIFKMAKQNALLTRQRDLLLPRLMSGKLEVK